MSMNIAIGYNNAFGVKASLNNIASVMEAYHQMDDSKYSLIHLL